MLKTLLKPKRIFLGVSAVVLLYLIKQAWKYRSHIQALLQLRSTLANAKNFLEPDPLHKEVHYEKLSQKFTVWNRVNLRTIETLKTNLRQKGITSTEKHRFWRDLAVTAFTQLLVNMYSSEIFKMIFLVSSHLAARKVLDGEDCRKMISSIDCLNASICEEFVIREFIETKIRPIIEDIPLTDLIKSSDLKIIFDKFKIELNCIKRIPMPVFEYSIKVFPESLKNQEDLLEFLQIFCLPEVQYELNSRIDSLYDVVIEILMKELHDNGKDYSSDISAAEKTMDFAHFIPIVSRQQGFVTWQRYDAIGRKIYFDLFSSE